ncbi:MAG TPA: cytochrome c [Thermoanaerobaculia bacterium]
MKLRPALLVAALSLAACGNGEEGAALYRQNCVRCHGLDGKGDRRSVQLDPRLDLTRSLMVQRRERGTIGSRISEGYQAMPGFSHRLERDQVEALVEYTLRFGGGKAGG